MPYTYSGDQNEHFENLVNTLASTEAELHQKTILLCVFSEKRQKTIKVQVATQKTYFYQIKSTFHWSVMVSATY